MIPHLRKSLGLIGLVALGAGAWLVHSSGASGHGAHVGVSLALPGGTHVESLDYSVDGQGVTRTGTVEIERGRPRIEFDVTGLAPGSYTLSVRARGNDGRSYRSLTPLRVAEGSTRLSRLSLRLEPLERGAPGGLTRPARASGEQRAGATHAALEPTPGATDAGIGCPNEIHNIHDAELCSAEYLVDDCGKDCTAITSDACMACERAVDDGTAECSHATGNAVQGPARGTPRIALCNQAVECMRRSNCAKDNHLDCYCGAPSGPDCFSGVARGACRRELEAALETTDGTEIAARFGDATLGGGVALLRLTSDREHCLSACFTEQAAE